MKADRFEGRSTQEIGRLIHLSYGADSSLHEVDLLRQTAGLLGHLKGLWNSRAFTGGWLSTRLLHRLEQWPQRKLANGEPIKIQPIPVND